MPIKAVLFDYGHTLVDFTVPEDALHEVYGQIREALVHEVKEELPRAPELADLVAGRVAERVEESYANDRLIELDILALFEQSLAGLGFAPNPEIVRWVAETEHTALTEHLIVPDATLEALRAIKGSSIQIGIVSNAHLLPYMMRRDWNNLGIGQHVDASLISSEVGIRKPHPDVFRRVLDELDVRPQEAVFVGDRLFDDVSGAQSVGMRGILTRQFRQEDPAGGTIQPDLVINRLEEVIRYVSENG